MSRALSPLAMRSRMRCRCRAAKSQVHSESGCRGQSPHMQRRPSNIRRSSVVKRSRSPGAAVLVTLCAFCAAASTGTTRAISASVAAAAVATRVRRACSAAAAARRASGHIAVVTPRTMMIPPSQIHMVRGFT